MRRIVIFSGDGRFTAAEVAVAKKNISVQKVFHDKAQLKDYHKRNKLPVFLVADVLTVVKNVSLKRSSAGKRKDVEELLAKRNVEIDLTKQVWSYAALMDQLNVFSVSKAQINDLCRELTGFNLPPARVEIKAGVLYNYFIWATDRKIRDFCYCYFTHGALSILLSYKGNIKFYEIPPLDKEELSSEMKRYFGYLQMQESISPAVFEKIYVTFENNSLKDIFNYCVGTASVELEKKSQDKDPAEYTSIPFEPVFIGAAVSYDEQKNPEYINTCIQVEAKIKTTALRLKTFFYAKSGPLAAAVLIFSAVWQFFIYKNVNANRAFLKEKQNLIEEKLPKYQELKDQIKPIKNISDQMKKDILEHRFIVEAVGRIAQRLKGIEVMQFSYSSQDQIVIDMNIKSKSYSEVSELLKDLRSGGLFSQVIPVSSETAGETDGEKIYFKVQLKK